MAPYAPLDIGEIWKRTNETIVSLVDVIPDDRLNWSPRPARWNFKGTLIHIISGRDQWLTNVIRDGVVAPDVLRLAQTKDGIKEQLGRSWERIATSLLSTDAQLGAEYETSWDAGRRTGHWVAFHVLEHDIHHRADIFWYLDELGVEQAVVSTP